MTGSLRTAAIFLAAAAAIAATQAGWQAGVYVFKPLATALILGLAASARRPPSPLYRHAIFTGLALSLAGDIFLMLPGDRFLAGLVSFLGAHLAYLVALTLGGGGFRWAPRALVPVLAASLGVLAVVWPGLGDLVGPVLGYILVISAMAWQAGGRWLAVRSQGARLAAVGAWLFLASDSLLAIRRFAGDFVADDVLILVTYWMAQWCLARSADG